MGALHDPGEAEIMRKRAPPIITQFVCQVQLDGVKNGLKMKEREVSGKRGDLSEKFYSNLLGSRHIQQNEGMFV